MSLHIVSWRRRVHQIYADVRSLSPAAAHDAWRNARNELFATHPASPLSPDARENFGGLRIADYDPALRFEVRLDPDVERARLAVPTGTDGVVVFERIGVLRLPGLGSLDAWWLTSYGGGLFVPIKDASAGSATYGGGRYLIDTVKGADLGGDVESGRLVVDLNFAYNPSCAYDPAWACPLAPPGNRLDVDVRAGELIPPPAHDAASASR